MKIRTFVFTTAAAVFAGLLALSSSTFAAPGGGNGPPDGGGSPPPPPVDFGDLFKLYRDADGVPILTAGDPVNSTAQSATAGFCQQPLASAECIPTAPVGCTLEQPVSGVYVVPTIQETCAVVDACSSCTEEVDFGRINDARSPASVFEDQLDDVVFTLVNADRISLDPAGRMVASTCDDPLDNLAKTIDSPLQNLAVYRELMLNGFIGAPPGLDLPDDIYDTAARGLGAASDKAGEVNKDLVAYLNEIMGLSNRTTDTVLGKICIDVREELQGVVQPVEKCFLNYGPNLSTTGPAGADYGYIRADNFGVLPAPAYIPPGDGTATEGYFEYLAALDLSVDPLDAVFKIQYAPVLDTAFCVDYLSGEPLEPLADQLCASWSATNNGVTEVGFTGGNIGGFAQAADDARRVIAFMHEHAVPVEFETPVPCEPDSAILYDVAIPEQSGLQVPVSYVNTKEREFTVTGTNNGPATANFRLTVAAYDEDPDTNPSALPIASWGPWDFFGVPDGQSRSVTQLFTITTSNATIYWKAAVEALPPGTDDIPGNNTASATSTVKASGGGGRP
jgi:hypothetical protein